MRWVVECFLGHLVESSFRFFVMTVKISFVTLLTLTAIIRVLSCQNRCTSVLVMGGHMDRRPTVECIFSFPQARRCLSTWGKLMGEEVWADIGLHLLLRIKFDGATKCH